MKERPVCKRRKLFANVLRPDSFTGGIAIYHGDGFGIWQQLLNVRDDRRKVVRDRNYRVIFHETGELNSTLLCPPSEPTGRNELIA